MRQKIIFLACCALLLLLLCAGAAAETAFYEEMPPYLRVTQETIEEMGAGGKLIRRTYPETASDQVNDDMRALIDRMTEEALLRLPQEKAKEIELDAGAVITRSGSSLMSFLVIAQANDGNQPLFVETESRVYDIETGRRIALSDLFDAQSGAWAMMEREVRAQLSAAYPGREIDQAQLDRFCGELAQADFTLGAARMTLTFPADTLYEGAVAPLHVHLYYKDISGLMTEMGKRQTDNSRFRMIALTFDDGCAGRSTRKVLDELRKAGAQATFFVVGKTISRGRHLLTRQQSSAYSIQSHTYSHSYPEDLTTELALEEKQRMNDALTEVTGVPPTMMRAPGGNEKFYIRREIGYPLLHWSLAGGDSGSSDDKKVARRVIHNAKDGDVVLLHDLNVLSWRYTKRILEDLCARGFLCVTVEELFADAGVPLEENTVYFSPYRIGE